MSHQKSIDAAVDPLRPGQAGDEAGEAGEAGQLGLKSSS